MKIQYANIEKIIANLQPDQPLEDDGDSVFGSDFDMQDFFKPFTLEEITPANQQSWPYYKYVSAHWDEFALHGTAIIKRSNNPAKLTKAEDSNRLDMNSEWKKGQTFLESLQATQVKGFVVMQDNEIRAEFYDNGFMVNDTNLLQSAAKTFAGVVTSQLIDAGELDPDKKVGEYLEDFNGTAIGAASVQQTLDMTSGLPNLLDYHIPGSPGQLWEFEIGLQAGETKGHRNNLKATQSEVIPGEVWNYSDKNTDTLGLVVEQVSGKRYPELLSDLFEVFGANYDGSIALTSDGTCSPNYGLCITARDYALFHQWLAQGKGPNCYYESAMDTSKTKIGENEAGKLLGKGITYGSQSYYLREHDVITSSGSFGQIGYSDMMTGVAVVFLQDWAANFELDKFIETRNRALAIIYQLREEA